ncbi:ParB/RepB/Spo0J family partition protein [Streptomyces sp. NBC_00557]|uniref:ParB/RepB/Spo0J family partition protein n=1 Tax=Streptomyces sp. NBC_00557 TaxID=2975776 RepID=UPI002E8225BA|nr:transcriptional regulator [Streptomyces sp. NBC_00557]WUC40277.1 ParB N-terminal domain-containing protein [Streptomyces sp. NBC_00557]
MAREDAEYLIRIRDSLFRGQPVEEIPVDTLVTGLSPRVDGEDPEHVRTLAETCDELPPILVHRPSMTVIDGVHRLRVAELRGQDRIAVRFFDGGLSDARLLAVATNITHGRPLSAADRTAAALRIFASHPGWSDRAVAAVAGLSPKRVGRLRKEAALPQTERRVGRDGRCRPVDSSHSRERAGELLRTNPGASLRQIAAQVGLAPATVADVRDRIRRGESPVPDRGRRPAAPPRSLASAEPPGHAAEVTALPAPAAKAGAAAGVRADTAPAGDAARGRQPGALRRVPAGPAAAHDDVARITEALRRDPSLRFSEAGRSLLRLLDACALVTRERRRIAATVPAHCKEPLARLAHGYAGAWRLLADDLARYVEETGDDAAQGLDVDGADEIGSLGA